MLPLAVKVFPGLFEIDARNGFPAAARKGSGTSSNLTACLVISGGTSCSPQP